MSVVKRVLVVDDDAAVRRGITRTLVNNGFETREAGDGNEALRLLGQDWMPAVVLLDYVLPGGNGDEVLMAVKREHPVLPVVMWSGNMDAVLRQKLISKGADACLSKPTQNDALIEILGRLADWTRSGLRAGPAPG